MISTARQKITETRNSKRHVARRAGVAAWRGDCGLRRVVAPNPNAIIILARPPDIASSFAPSLNIARYSYHVGNAHNRAAA